VIYKPAPLNTSAITLPEDLLALTEQLAENTHELWAAQRMSEGWRYGPRRDDASKQHPDLVPYAALPDGEQEYDRRTAMEALKVIIALGYTIAKP